MLMKRVWGHVLAGLSLLSGAALVFSGCVHDDSTLFVREALAPKTGGGTSCVYTPDPMQTFLTSGTLDIQVQGAYFGTFLVGNQMVPESNPNQLQTETSTITIQGAVVRITNAQGQEIKRFTRLTSSTIPPSAGTTTYSPVQVIIVDQGTLTDPNNADLQTLLGATLGTPAANSVVRLVTYTRFFGVTLGGKSVESNEFEFPVDICKGCLISFTNDPGTPGSPRAVPNCFHGTTVATTTPVIPCTPGQDQAVDCTFVCNDIPVCVTNSM
jgi:hypothetical protein